MCVKFNKNGVVNCTPIDGFDKVSIMKNKYIQEFSNYNNWGNGHWWGNSTESGFRRTTITFPEGRYLVIFKDGFDLASLGVENVVYIKYDSANNVGLYSDSSYYGAITETIQFNTSYDFRFYIQYNLTDDKLKTILQNTVLYKLDSSNDAIQAKDFIEL